MTSDVCLGAISEQLTLIYLIMIGRKARLVVGSLASNAPMSQCAPWRRVMPRWSRFLTGGAAQTASTAESNAALPGMSDMVLVGPPLLFNVPSFGSRLMPGQVVSG